MCVAQPPDGFRGSVSTEDSKRGASSAPARASFAINQE